MSVYALMNIKNNAYEINGYDFERLYTNCFLVFAESLDKYFFRENKPLLP